MRISPKTYQRRRGERREEEEEEEEEEERVQCPTASAIPNQQRPLLGGRPSVSNGHRPRRRGQRVLFNTNRNCCWASHQFFPYACRASRVKMCPNQTDPPLPAAAAARGGPGRACTPCVRAVPAYTQIGRVSLQGGFPAKN
ncbi:unnamed protein product [Prorocentrum cordatum]|uniref:Uncharacterized protein n=1 Tax=Prorocentrum cordatum TaxID=2364126 RepID=A0ABN9QXD6_9DINO|nr:unnamed protein product [Polarella glacialis]